MGKKGNNRAIDIGVEQLIKTVKSKYTLVPGIVINTRKAYLIIAFTAGFFAALILGVYIAWYPVSKAVTSTTIFSLTDNESHRLGDQFQTQIFLDSASQNIVAVQAVATFDPATVSVSGVDTSTSVFPNEALNKLDSTNHKIIVASGKPTPGINSTQAKIATINLQALKDFNGSGVTLKFASSAAVDDSAAIIDDGKGTNVLSAVLAKYTNPADTTPPVRSSGSPSGTLPSGTTSATLTLKTNEKATCKYSKTSQVAYSSMTNTFSTADGLKHTSSLSGLTSGKVYNYYVRCQDASGNVNTDDYKISFSIAMPVKTEIERK